MFGILLESRRAAAWPLTGGTLSLSAHAAVVGFAVATTMTSGARSHPPDGSGRRGAATLRWVRLAPTPRAPARTGGVRAARASEPRAGAPRRPATLTARPPAAPDPLAVDLSAVLVAELPSGGLLTSAAGDARRVSSAADFGPAADVATLAGLTGYVAAHAPGTPLREEEVERMTIPLARNPRPAYPMEAIRARLDGEVVVQFVVDTTGIIEPSSIQVLRSSDERFARAVRAVLPRQRFVPAHVAGGRVRVLVVQPYRFTVRPDA